MGEYARALRVGNQGPLLPVALLTAVGTGFAAVFAVNITHLLPGRASMVTVPTEALIAFVLVGCIVASLFWRGVWWHSAQLAIAVILLLTLLAEAVTAIGMSLFALPLSLSGSLLAVLSLTRRVRGHVSEAPRRLAFASENDVHSQGPDLAPALRGLHAAALIVDGDTQDHGHAVASLAARLGASLGMPPTDVDAVYWAALLHDVGKVGVPRSVLRKPAKLSAEEFETVKWHSTMGADLVRSIGDDPLLQRVSSMILHHHERWDGRGYPGGRCGDEIPLGARIIAITDVFEALISNRPYRSAMSHEAALKVIADGSGSHFDPDLVGIFLWMLSKGVDSDVSSPVQPYADTLGPDKGLGVSGTRPDVSLKFAQRMEALPTNSTATVAMMF